MQPQSEDSKNKIKFFGRRKGRVIHKAKQSLIDRFLPKISINAEQAGKLEELYPFKPKKFFLEIGFGNGEHLAGQALLHKDCAFLGAEVFQNGIANLLNLLTGITEGDNLPDDFSIMQDRTDNIRVYADDVRLLLPSLPSEIFDKIFVLFPDPWPKKKHASRRFINQENLIELTRILKKGGILRVATDHKVYKSWALRQMTACQKLRWTAKCSDDWRREPADHVQTKYQRKALAEGRRPVFFDFEKV